MLIILINGFKPTLLITILFVYGILKKKIMLKDNVKHKNNAKKQCTCSNCIKNLSHVIQYTKINSNRLKKVVQIDLFIQVQNIFCFMLHVLVHFSKNRYKYTSRTVIAS